MFKRDEQGFEAFRMRLMRTVSDAHPKVCFLNDITAIAVIQSISEQIIVKHEPIHA